MSELANASKGQGGEEAQLDPQVIIQRYQALQMECQRVSPGGHGQGRLVDAVLTRSWHPGWQFAAKLHECEIDLQEHQLVLNQLRPLDAGRRAYRLMGGVLVERTVGEIVPVLTETAAKVRT
jgi:hypothetical protein